MIDGIVQKTPDLGSIDIECGLMLSSLLKDYEGQIFKKKALELRGESNENDLVFKQQLATMMSNINTKKKKLPTDVDIKEQLKVIDELDVVISDLELEPNRNDITYNEIMGIDDE